MLTKLFQAYGFKITNHTQATYRPANSVLDVIATNCPDIVRQYGVTRCHYGTPHDFTRVMFRDCVRRRPGAVTIQKRPLSRVDVNEFHNNFSQIDWTPLFLAATIDEKWDVL